MSTSIETTEDRVIVRDALGRIRMTVRRDQEGDPVVFVFDADGRPAANVGYSPDDAQTIITLFRNDGQPAAGVALDDDGEATTVRFGRDGRTYVGLLTDTMPQPELAPSTN